MAYSYQTFTFGQVLTAAEVQQTEDNVRYHTHGRNSVAAQDILTDNLVVNSAGTTVVHNAAGPGARVFTQSGQILFQTANSKASGSTASLNNIMTLTASGVVYQKRGCLVELSKNASSAYNLGTGAFNVYFAPGAAVYDTDGIFVTNSYKVFQIPAGVSRASVKVTGQAVFANNEGGTFTMGGYGTTIVVNSTAYSRLAASGGEFFSFATPDFAVTSGQQLVLQSYLGSVATLQWASVQVDLIF